MNDRHLGHFGVVPESATEAMEYGDAVQGAILTGAGFFPVQDSCYWT